MPTISPAVIAMVMPPYWAAQASGPGRLSIRWLWPDGEGGHPSRTTHYRDDQPGGAEGDMRDKDRYLECAGRLREFLSEDTELGMTVSARRRLSMLNRAVNEAEADIARLDPLFTEVRARYIDALYHAKPKSGWLRAIVGTAIQDACETHGPDDPLVAQLRLVQKQAIAKAGKRIERKVRQAEENVARLRGGTEPANQYAFAMYQLAELYRRAGQYDAMINTFDQLMDERTRLDLQEDHLAHLEKAVADTYYDLGEVTRAAPLLADLYSKDTTRRQPNVSFDDLLSGTYLHLSVARCYLAAQRPEAAEAVLRESVERLRQHDHKLANRFFYRLRHRTMYELGSALWKQGRAREATTCFEEAHAIARGSMLVDTKAVVAYQNAKTYSLL